MPVAVPDTVRANFQFVVPPTDNSALYHHIDSDATGNRKRNYSLETKPVNVENIRGREKEFTVDNSGFQFFRKPTQVTDFTDDALIEEKYHQECIDLVKELTGGSRVVVFDHTVRRRQPGEIDDGPKKRQPAAQAHVDQTPRAAIARVHKHLPPDEAPELLKKRFQIINIWRPITNIALDWPLALCDFRSVDQEKDAVPVSLIYSNREPGETYGIRHNESQQWKYLRGMELDEGVLIKCYDSVEDGSVARFTPHTAFEDPSTPGDAPFRQSIEVRSLVFYD
jgi:hypothetical protein